MKKPALTLAVISAVFFFASISFAEDYAPQSDDRQMDRREPDDMQGGDRREMRMRDREGMSDEGRGKSGDTKMGMMKGGMMGMHQQSVVATSDGGVVILSGGKLAKYDANLVLVNEVEIKKDKGPKSGNVPQERLARRTPREEAPAVEAIPTPQFVEEAAPEPAPAAVEPQMDGGEQAPS